MLPRATADQLNRRGHDALSVHDVGLAGAEDTDVFADYSLLLTQRLTNEQPSTPVVFIHKSAFSEAAPWLSTWPSTFMLGHRPTPSPTWDRIGHSAATAADPRARLGRVPP